MSVPDEDVLTVFEDFDGMKAVTLFSGERRICDPCWRWSEEVRFAARAADVWEMTPNLCRSHLRRFVAGSEWDVPLGGKGRPRAVDYECSADACLEKVVARGLCRRHYQAAWRKGRNASEEA